MNQKKYCSSGCLIPSEASSPLLSTLMTVPYLQTRSLSDPPSISCGILTVLTSTTLSTTQNVPINRIEIYFSITMQHRALLLDKSHVIGCCALVHLAMQLIIESFVNNMQVTSIYMFMSTFTQLSLVGKEGGSSRSVVQVGLLPGTWSVLKMVASICVTTIGDATEHGPSSLFLQTELKVYLNSSYLFWLVREGNGTPLQHSCLGNPMDGGAWWAAIYGVAQNRTRLMWLSGSSSSSILICSISCNFSFKEEVVVEVFKIILSNK